MEKKNMYTEEQVDNALVLMGDSPIRPENIEYDLYVEARRQQNLTNKLKKMGGFHHISAQLIPKLGADGLMKTPVEWIGKTKGNTYENLEKQKIRKMELFAYYMSQIDPDDIGESDMKNKANKLVLSINKIDKKIQKNV